MNSLMNTFACYQTPFDAVTLAGTLAVRAVSDVA